ncbi:Cupredoxin [Papiliotrema laurentii]|uniref:Cupredoxin n=1 Tax=Papiliotrema laurentii TaxID=5418 RepID=A0AAD9FUF5_PAPLA|nr:Cupredoxin [Papiliotrema laurentii]
MLVKMYIAALSLAAVALGATTHEVVVGANGLKYDPDNVTAAVGDTVNFTFMPGNHTVTQSTFAAPCVNAGIASGFRTAAENTFSILINSTDPIWIYCSQVGHCQSGMVMAINAPATGNETLAAYRALAMGGSAASASSSGATGSSATSSASKTSAGAGGATSSPASSAAAASATSHAQSSGTASASASSTKASSSSAAGHIEPSVWGAMGLLLLSVVGLL